MSFSSWTRLSAGPVLCNDRCRCSRRCSTLTRLRAVTCPGVHASVSGCFWKNFTPSAHGNLDSFSTSPSYGGLDWQWPGFFGGIDAIFRTPPHGVESQLSADFAGIPRWPAVVGCRGLGGGGDAGTLTLRCSATRVAN